jgi:hypothetical protein
VAAMWGEDAYYDLGLTRKSRCQPVLSCSLLLELELHRGNKPVQTIGELLREASLAADTVLCHRGF